MRFYDKRWITIRFDESVQAVWVEWKAYAEGDEYRSALDAMIDLLRQTKSSRLLIDARLLGPVSQADQQWTHQSWHPRSLAAGLRWSALVSPRTSVARLSVKQMVIKLHHEEIVTQNFDDLELARAWLRNPTKSA